MYKKYEKYSVMLVLIWYNDLTIASMLSDIFGVHSSFCHSIQVDVKLSTEYNFTIRFIFLFGFTELKILLQCESTSVNAYKYVKHCIKN